MAGLPEQVIAISKKVSKEMTHEGTKIISTIELTKKFNSLINLF